MKKHQRQFLNNYKWWDHSYLLKAIEDWCKKASYCHKTKGVLVRSDETSKDLFIVYQLAKRLREDEVYSTPSKVFSCHNTEVKHFLREGGNSFTTLQIKRENEARKRDLNYLTHLMNRKLLTWWD